MNSRSLIAERARDFKFALTCYSEPAISVSIPEDTSRKRANPHTNAYDRAAVFLACFVGFLEHVSTSELNPRLPREPLGSSCCGMFAGPPSSRRRAFVRSRDIQRRSGVHSSCSDDRVRAGLRWNASPTPSTDPCDRASRLGAAIGRIYRPWLSDQ